jgi:hypothetical protein
MQLLPLFILVAVTSLCACRSSSEKEEIPFERVTTGQVSAVLEPKNVVARSPEEWRAFFRPTVIGASAEPQGIAWDRQMLVAVALGSRPSGGYSVEIERIHRKGSHWIVHARETRPAPGSIQTTMITSPIDCVATPRFDGKVVFVLE